MLLCPWNSPGKNTGVGSQCLLQENLPNAGLEPGSTTLQAGSLPSEPQRRPAKAVLIDKKGIRSGTLERKSKRENEGPECFFFKALKTGNITDLYVETQKIVVTI